MAKWSRFTLALVLALVYVGIGVFYLVPNLYHPFSGDTIHQTQQHLIYAGIFMALAVVALVAGVVSLASRRS